MEKKINVKQLTLCGVLAALVFVLTYFPKVPVPVTGGYVHLGDGAIFLAVLLLGPLGIPAAAIGSGLADLIGGYMLYVIPTVIIKGLVALVAWKLYRKGSWVSAVLAFVLAEAVMVLGYFLFECFTSGVPAAAAAILPNVVQGVAGVVLGLICVAVTPRMEKMMKL
ncbi:MAG: ECF transporter S component [Aristaeellaceae bacterium]